MSRFLKNLCGGRDFLWHSKAPHGCFGGMLLGVDQHLFDVSSVDVGDHYIKIQLCNKSDGFLAEWLFMVWHNPTTKKTFWLSWSEWVAKKIFHSSWVVISILYLRHPSEKNNANYQLLRNWTVS
jgi:hypothetical protein